MDNMTERECAEDYRNGGKCEHHGEECYPGGIECFKSKSEAPRPQDSLGSAEFDLLGGFHE